MTTTAPTSASQQTSDNPVIRIAILDNIASEGLAILQDTGGVEFEVRTGLSGDELREFLADFDGAVCRSGVKILDEHLVGNTRLKAIARAGVGTDNIDKEAATRKGIVVMNTPGGNTVSTAEHTMALILGLSRNVAPAHASLKAGNWDRKKFSGSQLQGKTLGVVGLGRIGQEVATRAKAFGMTVAGFDPFLSATQIEKLGVKPMETVVDLLPVVDYLTVHTPLTPETKGLIGEAEIEKLKPGARLINCARGGIYDEAALANGLESGKLGGVALDVYQTEPCTDSPLFGMDRVLCTPHLGASTEEAQIQVAEEAVTLILNYLQNGEIKHSVNTVAVDPSTLEELRGHIDLAHRLGILLGGWHGGAVEHVTMEFQGDLADKDHRILKSAFCSGLLKNCADDVNMINAQALAEERGIEMLVKVSRQSGAFNSVIGATVSGQGRSLEVKGTLFGREMPRLVQVGEYRTEAYMDGTLLIFTHRDVPGVIGYVGNVLATENVNIAQMAVGRLVDVAGGPAVGVLNLDTMVSEETIAKVEEFDGIESAVMINLPPMGESSVALV